MRFGVKLATVPRSWVELPAEAGGGIGMTIACSQRLSEHHGWVYAVNPKQTDQQMKEHNGHIQNRIQHCFVIAMSWLLVPCVTLKLLYGCIYNINHMTLLPMMILLVRMIMYGDAVDDDV